MAKNRKPSQSPELVIDTTLEGPEDPLVQETVKRVAQGNFKMVDLAHPETKGIQAGPPSLDSAPPKRIVGFDPLDTTKNPIVKPKPGGTELSTGFTLPPQPSQGTVNDVDPSGLDNDDLDPESVHPLPTLDEEWEGVSHALKTQVLAIYCNEQLQASMIRDVCAYGGISLAKLPTLGAMALQKAMRNELAVGKSRVGRIVSHFHGLSRATWSAQKLTLYAMRYILFPRFVDTFIWGVSDEGNSCPTA